MLSEWGKFFLLTGAAGTTLIGLFVLITLAGGVRKSVAQQGIRMFLTPTLVHFGGVGV